MAKVSIVTEIVDLVQANGGILELVRPDHAHIIDALAQSSGTEATKFRTELAQKHGLIVTHDHSIDPPEPCLIKRTGVTITSKNKTKKSIVKKKVSKASIEHEYILPNFIDELDCLLEAAKDWATEKSINIRFVGPMGCGKCHTKGTKIRMYNGEVKNVEDIKVGDFVMGDKSNKQKVLSTGNGTDELYVIHPKRGGKSFGVNSEHILRLWSSRQKKEINVTMNEFLNWSKSKQNSYLLLRTGVEYTERQLKVEPYFMGCWLGDGGKDYTRVTNIDEEVIIYLFNYAMKLGLNLSIDNQKDRTNTYMITSGLKGANIKFNPNNLLEAMREYGLCIDGKFIPKEFMINSRENRLQLLAGLVDTDGSNHGNCIDLVQERKELAEQIYELAGSLGFGVTIKDKIIDGKTYTRLCIYGDLSIIPTKIKRKQFTKRRDNWKSPLRTGFNVESIGKGEYFGFTIGGNHLYLLDDFTITHNTELAVILGKRCGFDYVYQMNGRADMTSGDLLGEKVVEVDEKSMQSFIKLQRGILEQSMTHGLEKDENGNVVLDKNGNVQVIGAPALLFYDEYASAPSEVNIMLNQITQIPRKPGQSRELVLTNDGGRTVKSHPGFCIIFSGNTNGKGLSDESQMVYTAQDAQQDGSFLDRIKPVFQFGYNLKAEKNIMMSKLADDVLVSKMIEFVQAMRNQYIERNVETLLSTRGIVDLCDNIRRYRKKSFENFAERAIHRTLVSDLTPNEVGAWAESIQMIFGANISQFDDEDDMWKPTLKLT